MHDDEVGTGDEDGDDYIMMPPLTTTTMLLAATSRATIIRHTGIYLETYREGHGERGQDHAMGAHQTNVCVCACYVVVALLRCCCHVHGIVAVSARV